MAQIPNLQSTNTLGVDDQAILRQGTIDKRIGLNLAGILSWARRNGYNHLGEHTTGIQFPDTASFTTFQGKTYFVNEGVTLPYSSTSNDPVTDDNLYSKDEDSLKDEIHSAVSNINLLSNHNFLVPSSLVVDATAQDVASGVEIFSGVFTGTSGVQGLTYIDGRVNFTGGDFYFPVSNTRGLEFVTEFTASVADFDGKPRTRGVSFALVGDEYHVTVGVDALEDTGGNATPLGSVKFEQGGVATRHEVSSEKIYGTVFCSDYKVATDPDDTLALERAMVAAYPKSMSVQLYSGMKINGQIDISYMDFSAPIKLKGGSIHRDVNGPIFVATASGDNNRDAPILEGIGFFGGDGVVPVVFDVDGSRRHQSYRCYYRKFCFFAGSGYSQSLRFSNGNTVYLQPAPFFKAETFYDPKWHNNQFETAAFPLVEATGTLTTSGPYSITGGAFNENLLEGYATVSPFIIPHCKSFSIDDNYFEGNLNLLKQRHLPSDPNTGYRLEGFSCVENYMGANKSNVVLDIPVGKLGNSDIDLNDVTFDAPDLVNNVFINDNLYQSAPERNTVNGGRLVPSSARVFQDIVSDSAKTSLAIRYEYQDLSPSGKRIVVKNLISRLSTSSANSNICRNSFVVTISGQSNAASVNYKFNYVGLMSFASANNGGVVSLEVSITNLVNMHTNGNVAPGEKGTESDLVVKFPNNTTLKPFNEAHAENQIYFEMPNIEGVDNVCITPFNNVMVQSGFHALPFYSQ